MHRVFVRFPNRPKGLSLNSLRREASRLYIRNDGRRYMTYLYKNKYRISSARLQTWNYGDNGMYFVTICTANRECFFGNIVENSESQAKMQLNDLGERVEEEWLKTPTLRADMNLELMEYVIMPNHFHGIIYIGENLYNQNRTDAMYRVLNNHNKEEMKHQVFDAKNKFGTQSKNLASIIRGFKSAVTMYARKNNIPFNWQASFHDHIISSNKEYQQIADYMIDNPAKWQKDKFYQ